MNSTSTLGLVKHFDWTEYLVFILMLGVSLAIGLYFGFYKGGQKTVGEYLLGNKEMNVFPVSMSLISSQISGVTLLGVPTEIYTHGTQFAAVIFTNILVAVITMTIFLPVFYKLQLLSLFEYLGLRFDTKVRNITSLLYIISTILFIPIVVYGPAIALNQVSGVNIHIVTPVICFICIFYTMLGGLRGVVWTDAVQGIAMIFAVFTVVILGVRKAGGFSIIFDRASEGDRLEFFNLDVDPTTRISFWSILFGHTFTLGGYMATNPGVVQRFISLPTYRQAQISECCLVIGMLSFLIPSVFIGLTMYAVYKDCDPLHAKIIDRPDQILPYFVLDIAEHIKGLPGLFIVGILSAALSTMSTGLNTVSGTIFEDFIQPHLKNGVSDKTANFIMKVLVVAIGIVCVTLVYIIDNMGGAIIEVCVKFSGVTNGTILGIFTLGILFPTANSLGALMGGIISFCLMVWIMVGNLIANGKGLIKHSAKPVSIKGCSSILSNFTQLPFSHMNGTTNHMHNDVWPIYKLSMFYYAMVGCLTVIIVGMIVTYLTGPIKPETMNPKLFCQFVTGKPLKTHFTVVKSNEDCVSVM